MLLPYNFQPIATVGQMAYTNGAALRRGSVENIMSLSPATLVPSTGFHIRPHHNMCPDPANPTYRW